MRFSPGTALPSLPPPRPSSPLRPLTTPGLAPLLTLRGASGFPNSSKGTWNIPKAKMAELAEQPITGS